jgi:glycerol-3-phosphate dehydrogenase
MVRGDFMTKADGHYDVIIIGAGIAGATAARELSKYRLSIAVVEKEADVSFGATKGTHGIIHCGIPGPGTPLRDRGELMGNLMMEGLCRELDVPFKRVGKLLVGFSKEEVNILRDIEHNTRENGVAGVELIQDRHRLKEMEPNLSDDVVGALYTPTTAVTSPWSLVIALMENARDNGVGLYLNARVTDVKKTPEDDFMVTTCAGALRASFVINAAGVYADKIAGMIGDRGFTIKALRQQRIILDKRCNGVVRRLVRGLSGTSPTGNFVTPTVDGNIMVGCKVEEVADVEDVRTTREGLKEWVIPQYLKLIPSLAPENSIKPFAGLIPLAGDDYYIKSAPDSPRFVNLVLGASGFTASPAMAQYLVEEVLPAAGLTLEHKRDFNPYRRDIPHFSELDNVERGKLISKNLLFGHIVCRCETVSEGEILEAIRRGAATRDGIKFRTRAGMGRCQGNFCGHKVLEIMSRELGVPAEEVTRKGGGSEELL